MDSAPGNDLQAIQTELNRLESYRRRIYLGVLILTIVIVLLSWAFRENGDPFIAIAYPVFAVVLAGLGVALWYRATSLRRMEIILIAAVGTMILSRLAWHFHFGDPLGQHLLLLAGGHYWAVGILIVSGFITLGYRGGMVTGVATFLFSAALAAYEILGCSAAAEGACQNWVYLARIHLFLAILLALTSAGTFLRERTWGAFTRAETLQHWANTDPLCGLSNRRGADGFLAAEAALADRYQRPLTIILIDIDQFKGINDDHGHKVGDSVIRGFADILANTVREVDLAARWGGDEFLVATPGVDLRAARHAAERCRRAIERAPIAGISVTVTVGIAQYLPGKGIDDAINRADAMLYRAKAAGRNRVITEACELA
ncbi:GGDEF domain-containing protein [Marinobacter sp. TBZ242]|uniref:diguanylate cyclase n=1 Tax=Marinobacter azerbaijanicus TaxID=3050455 RepID=A0ABT7I8E5_9GAMM|nr:GGDEF domain-containing protein [Marinobacter sp. TBZ242]MDL0430436.1 GGDEF domain-containing protein [Marinobacter sp. TBZ242]